MSIAVRPLFVGERDARRFYLHLHPTDRAPRAGLVFVAPWAEEMNKSRRMVALAARAASESSARTGRLAAARFFFHYELPKIGAWLQVVRERDLTCAELPEDAF